MHTIIHSVFLQRPKNSRLVLVVQVFMSRTQKELLSFLYVNVVFLSQVRTTAWLSRAR